MGDISRNENPVFADLAQVGIFGSRNQNETQNPNNHTSTSINNPEPEVISSNSLWRTGWNFLKPLFGREFNGFCFYITKLINKILVDYTSSLWTSNAYSGRGYMKNKICYIVNSAGKKIEYRSKVDNNLQNPTLDNGLNWENLTMTSNNINLPLNYLDNYKLELLNDTMIGITEGAARSEDNMVDIINNNYIKKNINKIWSEGSVISGYEVDYYNALNNDEVGLDKCFSNGRYSFEFTCKDMFLYLKNHTNNITAQADLQYFYDNFDTLFIKQNISNYFNSLITNKTQTDYTFNWQQNLLQIFYNNFQTTASQTDKDKLNAMIIYWNTEFFEDIGTWQQLLLSVTISAVKITNLQYFNVFDKQILGIGYYDLQRTDWNNFYIGRNNPQRAIFVGCRLTILSTQNIELELLGTNDNIPSGEVIDIDNRNWSVIGDYNLTGNNNVQTIDILNANVLNYSQRFINYAVRIKNAPILTATDELEFKELLFLKQNSNGILISNTFSQGIQNSLIHIYAIIKANGDIDYAGIKWDNSYIYPPLLTEILNDPNIQAKGYYTGRLIGWVFIDENSLILGDFVFDKYTYPDCKVKFHNGNTQMINTNVYIKGFLPSLNDKVIENIGRFSIKKDFEEGKIDFINEQEYYSRKNNNVEELAGTYLNLCNYVDQYPTPATSDNGLQKFCYNSYCDSLHEGWKACRKFYGDTFNENVYYGNMNTNKNEIGIFLSISNLEQKEINLLEVWFSCNTNISSPNLVEIYGTDDDETKQGITFSGSGYIIIRDTSNNDHIIYFNNTTQSGNGNNNAVFYNDGTDRKICLRERNPNGSFYTHNFTYNIPSNVIVGTEFDITWIKNDSVFTIISKTNSIPCNSITARSAITGLNLNIDRDKNWNLVSSGNPRNTYANIGADMGQWKNNAKFYIKNPLHRNFKYYAVWIKSFSDVRDYYCISQVFLYKCDVVSMAKPDPRQPLGVGNVFGLPQSEDPDSWNTNDYRHFLGATLKPLYIQGGFLYLKSQLKIVDNNDNKVFDDVDGVITNYMPNKNYLIDSEYQALLLLIRSHYNNQNIYYDNTNLSYTQYVNRQQIKIVIKSNGVVFNDTNNIYNQFLPLQNYFNIDNINNIINVMTSHYNLTADYLSYKYFTDSVLKYNRANVVWSQNGSDPLDDPDNVWGDFMTGYQFLSDADLLQAKNDIASHYGNSPNFYTYTTGAGQEAYNRQNTTIGTIIMSTDAVPVDTKDWNDVNNFDDTDNLFTDYLPLENYLTITELNTLISQMQTHYTINNLRAVYTPSDIENGISKTIIRLIDKSIIEIPDTQNVIMSYRTDLNYVSINQINDIKLLCINVYNNSYINIDYSTTSTIADPTSKLLQPYIPDDYNIYSGNSKVIKDCMKNFNGYIKANSMMDDCSSYSFAPPFKSVSNSSNPIPIKGEQMEFCAKYEGVLQMGNYNMMDIISNGWQNLTVNYSDFNEWRYQQGVGINLKNSSYTGSQVKVRGVSIQTHYCIQGINF